MKIKDGIVKRIVARVAILAIALIAASMPAQAAVKKIIVLGDSLSAGFGIGSGSSMPAQLQRQLRARGHQVRIINYSRSGMTTAGGLSRLGAVIAQRPHAVIVQLGANDIIYGGTLSQAKRNLNTIVSRLRRRGIKVMVVATRLPKRSGIRSLNRGKTFRRRADAAYRSVARRNGAIYEDNLMGGVMGQRGLTLSDGLHPNRRGVSRMTRRLLPKTQRLLGGSKARRTAKRRSARKRRR